jgi:uncharacterized protein
MKKLFTIVVALMLATGAMAQVPFPPLDTNYRATELRVSSNLNRDVLFEGNRDAVWNGSSYGVAKTWHDFTGLMPLGTGNDSCLLIVNHELRTGSRNPILGDGGGMTVFRVNKVNNRWLTVPYRGQKYWQVDFSNVRGTYTNCAGLTLRNGRFMTAEEVVPGSNAEISSNFSDTSDYVIPNGPFAGRTIKAFQQYGWMTAVDAPSAKALYKSYAMGRSSYEGGYAMPDGKTVYLTTDATPAALIRFTADTVDNFQYGQLAAYKQNANGVGGIWMDLPRTWDSIVDVTRVAFKRGATMFTRLEWATLENGKMYIAETGNDAANYKSSALLGGVPSLHFQRADTLGGAAKDSIYNDFYGRVLELDMTTNTMRVFVEGGRGPKFTFSNPDGLSIHRQNNKSYLVICEDINGTNQGRSGGNGINICEAFFVDLTVANPTLSDLTPFVACPAGAELTGTVSTPDGKTMFINSQHADANNVAPYNNDATVAITGFSFATPTKELEVSPNFKVYPNPASDIINFNKTVDVAIYNLQGQQIRVERNANQINVSELTSGVYFLQTINGEVVKIVKD